MGFSYNIPKYQIIPDEQIKIISEYSFRILIETGVKVYHNKILDILSDHGASVDKKSSTVKFNEEIINKAIKDANKKHILYGRDKNNTAEFGYETFNFNGSSGQYQIVDSETNIRRSPTLKDLKDTVMIGENLDCINMTGSLVVPSDVPFEVADILSFYYLILLTSKPFTAWVFSGKNARIIIEMMEIVSGSKNELRRYPFYEVFIEPISPLTLRKESLDILIEFADAGLPVGFSPMVQTGATGPCSLVGTMAQENAEILSGIIIAQLLKPGLPVTYGGIPHFFDMKAQMISFGSPEQALMAAGMTQLGKYYGFPVYNNTGMSDSKCMDAQYGIESAGTLAFGLMSGGDIFGHLGILGSDNAASLTQLIIDNETASFYRRIFSGFAFGEIEESFREISDNIGGNFFGKELTLKNFRKSFWYPKLFDRAPWDTWVENGSKNIIEKAQEQKRKLLKEYKITPLDDEKLKELNKVIKGYCKYLSEESLKIPGI